MDASNGQILILMGVYLLFSIGIGVWYAKRSNIGSSEYFLGGRSLGPWVTAMSAEASDMSGWLLMGLPGVASLTGGGRGGLDRHRTRHRHLPQLAYRREQAPFILAGR